MKRHHDSGYGPKRLSLGGSEESAKKRAKNRARVAAGRKRRPKAKKHDGVVSTFGMGWEPPKEPRGREND